MAESRMHNQYVKVRELCNSLHSYTHKDDMNGLKQCFYWNDWYNIVVTHYVAEYLSDRDIAFTKCLHTLAE